MLNKLSNLFGKSLDLAFRIGVLPSAISLATLAMIIKYFFIQFNWEVGKIPTEGFGFVALAVVISAQTAKIFVQNQFTDTDKAIADAGFKAVSLLDWIRIFAVRKATDTEWANDFCDAMKIWLEHLINFIETGNTHFEEMQKARLGMLKSLGTIYADTPTFANSVVTLNTMREQADIVVLKIRQNIPARMVKSLLIILFIAVSAGMVGKADAAVFSIGMVGVVSFLGVYTILDIVDTDDPEGQSERGDVNLDTSPLTKALEEVLHAKAEISAALKTL